MPPPPSMPPPPPVPQDPPRPEVRAAVEQCRAAGIRVIMVTGDNKSTAESVATQIGLIYGPSSSSGAPSGAASLSLSGAAGGGSSSSGVEGLTCLTGVEFDDLSPPQQADAVGASLAVFVRVEPNHKTKLVELLRAQVRACPSVCACGGVGGGWLRGTAVRSSTAVPSTLSAFPHSSLTPG